MYCLIMYCYRFIIYASSIDNTQCVACFRCGVTVSVCTHRTPYRTCLSCAGNVLSTQLSLSLSLFCPSNVQVTRTLRITLHLQRYLPAQYYNASHYYYYYNTHLHYHLLVATLCSQSLIVNAFKQK